MEVPLSKPVALNENFKERYRVSYSRTYKIVDDTTPSWGDSGQHHSRTNPLATGMEASQSVSGVSFLLLGCSPGVLSRV